MIRSLALLIIAASLAQPSFAALTFDWAFIGNSGNAPDLQTGYGAVGYDFAISKTEVTNAQYVEFLNAVAATEGFGGADPFLFAHPVVSPQTLGIIRSGSQGSFTYAVRPPVPGLGSGGSDYAFENQPVMFISMFDAMRFVNWMHNGQGSGGTESGVYEINDGVVEVRSTDAKFWIPSEDEWYKAAYHDASAGLAGSYFDYATRSDATPASAPPSGDIVAANFLVTGDLDSGVNGGYALIGSRQKPADVEALLTEVGAYSASESPYGTYDQNGNVSEWTEGTLLNAFRILRGGSWSAEHSNLLASYREGFDAEQGSSFTGFRIAGPASLFVPEPTALALAAMVAGYAMMTRRRHCVSRRS